MSTKIKNSSEQNFTKTSLSLLRETGLAKIYFLTSQMLSKGKHDTVSDCPVLISMAAVTNRRKLLWILIVNVLENIHCYLDDSFILFKYLLLPLEISHVASWLLSQSPSMFSCRVGMKSFVLVYCR